MLIGTLASPTVVNIDGVLCNGLGAIGDPIIRNVPETVSRWMNVYRSGYINRAGVLTWFNSREECDRACKVPDAGCDPNRDYVIREDCKDGEYSVHIEEV